MAVYRISLEGITNIIRHADADTAVVRISQVNDHLILEISDDGVGIPTNVTPGVGLTSMSERADELGGTFEFMPQEKGTHIRVRLPFVEEENDE